MPVIGRVSVILKKADITKENVDVIVNSSNQNLDLNTGSSSVLFLSMFKSFFSLVTSSVDFIFHAVLSGVSGDILNAAGKSVVDECKKHGNVHF